MIDPSGAPDPPLGMPDPPRDRFEFWVRFTFGALFGLLIGLLLWIREFYWQDLGWLAFPISGLVFAFAAAHYGDNFWASLRFWKGFHRWW